MKSKLPALLLLISLLFSLPAAGAGCAHANVTEEILLAPTCTAGGSRRAVCADCGEALGEPASLPPTGHSFGKAVTVPATWAKAGKTTRTCEVCGFQEVAPIAKLRHLPPASCPDGDADLNGRVTAADARLVLRAAVAIEDGLDREQLAKADLDRDGRVSAADARGVLRLSVGLDPFAPTLLPGYTFLRYTSADCALAEKDGVTYAVTKWGYILLANKTYSLPRDYAPGDLTPECRAAYNRLVNGAAKAGINIYLISGYRSYDRQYSLYHRYAASDGYAGADTYSARPGHSEHQSGLAMDVNSLYASFAYTREGRWLAAHAHEYGFVIRYPADKTAITGYIYEPWHIRYLGEGLAKELYTSGLCLEEYLGIDSRYSY